MNIKHLVLVAALLLVLLEQAACFKCDDQCTINNNICCNGKNLNTGKVCGCVKSNAAPMMMEISYSISGENMQAPAPTVRTMSAEDEEEEEGEPTLSEEVLDVLDAEMTLGDVPVCSFSCKDVCSDCSNDVNLIHTLSVGTSDLCVTKKHVQKLNSKLQKELVRNLQERCANVCTKCKVLSVDASVALEL